MVESEDEAEAEGSEKGEEEEGKEEKEKPKARRQGGVSVPEEWPWREAKRIFEQPDVTPADKVELEWKNPDVDGLVDFLVREKGFKCASYYLVVVK